MFRLSDVKVFECRQGRDYDQNGSQWETVDGQASFLDEPHELVAINRDSGAIHLSLSHSARIKPGSVIGFEVEEDEGGGGVLKLCFLQANIGLQKIKIAEIPDQIINGTSVLTHTQNWVTNVNRRYISSKHKKWGQNARAPR